MKIYDSILSCYADYAGYVNRERALPFCYDGLKSVQRRLLCATKELGYSRFIKSASLCGITVARYHPHSTDAVYGALVGMVQAPQSLFESQGQFGGFGLYAAAMRYTQVRLSELGKAYIQLIDQAPVSESEAGSYEPNYLPVTIPYALMAGAMGIGVGIATMIPPFTLKSLVKYMKYLIKGGREPSLEFWVDGIVKTNDMKSIVDSGKGVVIYRPFCTKHWDTKEGANLMTIQGDAPFIDTWVTKLSQILKEDLDQGWAFMRNESTNKLLVKVGREKGIRRITDDQLFKKITNRMYKSVTVKMNWSTESGPRTMGVREVMERSLSVWSLAEHSRIYKELEKLELEFKFEQSKVAIGKSLLSGRDQVIATVYGNELLEYAKRKSMGAYLEPSKAEDLRVNVNTLKAMSDDVFGRLI